MLGHGLGFASCICTVLKPSFYFFATSVFMLDCCACCCWPCTSLGCFCCCAVLCRAVAAAAVHGGCRLRRPIARWLPTTVAAARAAAAKPLVPHCLSCRATCPSLRHACVETCGMTARFSMRFPHNNCCHDDSYHCWLLHGSLQFLTVAWWAGWAYMHKCDS